MSDVVPQFPRGFVLARSRVDVPSEYVPVPVLPNFHAHPWSEIDTARDDDGRFVVVVGTCVSVASARPVASVAAELLAELRHGDARLLSALDWYAGRHAVIFGDRASVKVTHDATAMRSLFYAAEGGVVASHAVLVERALGPPVTSARLPFRFGYPGNRVPYARTRLLTANTLYDLTLNRVSRYWPSESPISRTSMEAAQESLAYASTALQNAAAQRPVKVALTAGLDSRALVAVALHSGIPFETYTYGTGPDTEVDRALAPYVARRAGVSHTVIPTVAAPRGLEDALATAHYSTHHRNVVPALMAWFGDSHAAAVTANLLEIGRSFYKGARNAGMAAPVTPEAMSALHEQYMGRRVKAEIAAYGRDAWHQVADAAFRAMIEETDYLEAAALLDPFDLFYWEHRMSAWHGPAMVERDFYAEPFIPFNARAIFTAMLGVPPSERDTGAALMHLVDEVDTRLMDLPINPSRWPPG